MLRLIRTRARDEGGFTMIATILVMMVVLGLTLAALSAASADQHQTGRDQSEKAAYAAAEAGVAAYENALDGDSSYWSKCDTVPGVQQPGAPGSALTKWLDVPSPSGQTPAPGSSPQYAIELLPANGATCDTSNPDGTMIDQSTGAFRVRVTGRANASSPVHRTIVATFKRSGFLDYIYWTDLEDTDPVVFAKLYSCDSGTSPPTCYQTQNPDLQTWANSQCNKYWRDGRGNASYPSTAQINVGGTWKSYSSWLSSTYGMSSLNCGEINFVTGDNVNGPLHTNDGLLLCGTPYFGRAGSSDRVEVTAQQGATPDQQPWRSAGCGGTSLQVRGVWAPGAVKMQPPPTNSALAVNADRSYTGGTKIVFTSDGKMTVTNGTQTQTVDQPANGVIYVSSSGCSRVYDPDNPYVYDGTSADPCGDVSVSGTYTQNMTIGADNDIVVTDDLTASSANGPMLGLIANNYVRVAHPSTLTSTGTSTAPWPRCKNSNTTTTDITIDAAILALNHSFTVDRYGCGAALGTLHLVGTIAQEHRGAVGANGGSFGYLKDYTYDDRLRYRSPPRFLDPVNSAWHIARQVEQVPAR